MKTNLMIVSAALAAMSCTPKPPKNAEAKVMPKHPQATEVLLRDLAAGKVSPKELLRAESGFYEVIAIEDPNGQGTRAEQHYCGAEAEAALLSYAKKFVARAEAGKATERNPVSCYNYLEEPDENYGAYDEVDGHPKNYSTCDSVGAAEWDENYVIVFFPDEVRGLRAAGVAGWEIGAQRYGKFQAQIETQDTALGCKP